MGARRLAVWVLLVSLSLAGFAPSAGAADDPTATDSAEHVPELTGRFEELMVDRGDRPDADTDADVDGADGTARVLVRPATDRAALDRAVARRGAEVVDTIEQLGFVVVESDRRDDDERLADELEADPAVAEAVVDQRRTTLAPRFREPNDPHYRDQRENLNLVRATEAWPITVGSSDVVVAVIDTGVDRGHPDLTGRVLAGRDLVDGGTRPPDPNGHGTAVASVLAAAGDDKVGMAGIAWKARILPVRVLDEDGGGWDSDVATGIAWAADQGARVINLSLGGPEPSPVLEAAVAYATAKGALVVAAAGNHGSDEPMYPAAIAGVLTVGATDSGGNLTDYSSYGDWVDLAAPGFAVLAATPVDQGGHYVLADGTSLAAPFVSGTAALILAQHPNRTATQLARTLRTTARDVGPPGIDPYLGWGVLDVAAAVGANLPDPLPGPEPDGQEPNDVPGRARAITLDAWHDATIDPEGDVDWYRFDVVRNGRVFVRVIPPPTHRRHATSMDVLIGLFDADLRLVGVASGLRAGVEVNLIRDITGGRVYLAVMNLSGSRSNGGYTVRVSAGSAPTFEPARSLGISSNPEVLHLADVTGDGIDDLLVTTRQDRRLRVLPGLADGGFDAPRLHPLPVLDALGGGIATLDLNDDGALDAVVATTTGLQAFVQQDGHLVHLEGADAPFLPSARPMLVAAGDVTGDGRDVVVATHADGGTWLSTRTAEGWDREQISAVRYVDLAVGDLDGDGVAEVIGIGTAPQVEIVRLVDDEWVVTAVPTIATGSDTQPFALAVADADGDGLSDILVMAGWQAPSSSVHALLQQPDGSFVAGPPAATAPSPRVLVAGDVDGDGVADAVSFHRSDNTIRVRGGDGVGGFAPRPDTLASVGIADLNRHSTVLHDVDRDGDLDLITGVGNGVRWYAAGVTARSGPADVWVRDISPAPGNLKVSATPTITIDLAVPLDPASVTSSTVRLRDGRTGAIVAASSSYDASRQRITLVPSAPLLGGTPYRIDVDGIVDVWGEAGDVILRSPFVVARDKVKPGPIANLTSKSLVDAAELRWTNPTDPDLAYVEVRSSTNNAYPGPTGGMLLYRGTGTRYTVPGEWLGGDGYVSVYAIDRSGNASTRAGVRVRRTALNGWLYPTTVTHGSKVTITSHLQNATTGANLGGRDVDLLHRPAGQSNWTRVATKTTAKDGLVNFERKPTTTTAYRLRYRGASDYTAIETTVGTAKVRSAVTAKLSSTSVKKGATVRLTGTVAPVRSGATLDIERRRSDGTWGRVGTTKVRSDGTYRFDVVTTSKGTHRYRVRMPATDTNVAGVSPTVSLTVS